jgi:ATP-dependent DNA helicase DinG
MGGGSGTGARAAPSDALDLLDAVVAGFDGEQRDGQRELATAVADALRDGHHLVAEAPTGSGKSLAYLAPAIASGLRVVVATSTIALQNQLVAKDLPALQRHGSVPFTFALLKGRSNYLCRAKLHAAAAPDALFERAVGANFPEELRSLGVFAATSETGDRNTLTDTVSDATWSAVSCTSIECPGRAQCSHGEDCFAELARENARGVSILVVNHALLCADLASHGNVLPEHDVVILDEAHAFSENATNAFGAELLPESLTRLASMLATVGVARSSLDALSTAANALSGVVNQRDGRIDLAKDTHLHDALQSTTERLATAQPPRARLDDERARRAAQLASGRLEVLRRLAAPAEDDVVWVEDVRRSRRLRIAPVAVGGLLAHVLLSTRPVIAVSATLGGTPPFAGFAARTGYDPAAAVGTWPSTEINGEPHSGADADDEGHDFGTGYVASRTPSSFDWRAQGMLYVANDLPDPTRANETWLDGSADRLCALVDAAGGRALVLCTSHANVHRFADVLRERTEHEVLAQGDKDVGNLTRSFIDDETSVLVGTRSFWAGIDVPGVSCVLVVIDRIPFPSPGDPLHAARRERAERRGLNAFAAVDLPAAALVLAQGAGRLIRTREDRGVVAVLDPRLAQRSYRTELLSAMPPLRRSVDLTQVRAFLADSTAPEPLEAT